MKDTEKEDKTLDLDDYISQRKEKDSDFADDFDSSYEEFKASLKPEKLLSN